jgi:hypothetical protein
MRVGEVIGGRVDPEIDDLSDALVGQQDLLKPFL